MYAINNTAKKIVLKFKTLGVFLVCSTLDVNMCACESYKTLDYHDLYTAMKYLSKNKIVIILNIILLRKS